MVATGLEPHTLSRARLYVLIDAVESDLRDVLRRWILPFKTVEDALGGRLDVLQARARAEGNDQPAADELVDYLDFADAFSLINAHRSMVPADVREAVRATTPKLERFVPVRNRVMHGRPLQPDDIDAGYRIYSELAGTGVEWARTERLAKQLVDDPAWSPIPTLTRESSAILHNLPLPDFDETGLLGRSEESSRLMELLLARRNDVITIVGEGGLGKTALAVKVLYDLVDEPNCPYGAVLWYSLKTEQLTGYGVRRIGEAARDLVGITHGIGRGLDDSFAGSLVDLADVLQGTDTLVVIDNLESADSEEVVRFYDAMPSGTGFLFTSRVGLGQLERRFPVEPLSTRDAKLMLRKLAERRGLPQLARLPDDQCGKQVAALRFSPLAIRWYVEAVDAGGEPHELLADQSDLLEFCTRTIYEGLGPAAREVLAILFAVDTALTLPELAIISELELDELRSALQELQRRSLVTVGRSLEGGIAQKYGLSAVTGEYVRTLARPSRERVTHISDQLDEMRRSEEARQVAEERNALDPNVVVVDADHHRPVAHLLRKALKASWRNQPQSAREHLQQARQIAPNFFEVDRVEAFIESHEQPQRAEHLYRDAYEKAPSAQRPRVAYFHAGHLANTLKDSGRAEPLAREAHHGLGAPATELRLGRVLMYQGLFEDAKTHIEAVVENADDDRTLRVAHTDLLGLAHRDVERLLESARKPVEAASVGAETIERAEAFATGGLVDKRLNEAVVRLAIDVLHASVRCGKCSDVVDALIVALESLDRRIDDLRASGRRQYWDKWSTALSAREDCPDDIAGFINKIDVRLSRRDNEVSGTQRGQIRRFSGKRGGELVTHEGREKLGFAASAVAVSEDQIFLRPGVEVTFSFGRDKQGNCADNVAPALTPEVSRRILANRRGVVASIHDTYAFVVDRDTEVSVFAHRTAFASHAEWRAVARGDSVVFDVLLGDRGPAAAKGSAKLRNDEPTA